MVDLEVAAKSPSTLRQLHLLGEIYRLSEGGKRRQIPTAGLYNEGQDRGVDVSALRSDFTALKAAGWLYFEASAAGVDEILITQEGIDVALEYQAKRSNPRQRASSLKTALLKLALRSVPRGGGTERLCVLQGRFRGQLSRPCLHR